MPRLASLGSMLALLGLAVLACNKTEQGGSIGSPSAAGAGSESERPGKTGDSKAPSTASELARSLVAVAATAPTDAQPCERTCGRVGDCLLETHDVGDFEAGRLEFECLDLCVHSSDSGESRSAFLACEQKSSCGELLGCARSNWDSLVAVRTGPVVAGVTGGGDPCVEGCRWLFSCIYTGAPPGQVYLAPEYEEHIRGCELQCQEAGQAEREQMAYFVECLPTHCGIEHFDACMLNYPSY